MAAQESTVAIVASSTFDTDHDGWSMTTDARCSPQPCYTPDEGDPGGAIYSDDGLLGVPFYFSAPAKFLGDASVAYKQYLTFSMRQDIRDQTPTDYPDVILNGAGMELVFDTVTNPRTVWGVYDVLLDETAGWHKDTLTGPAPSAAEMQAVLGSLTQLRLRGDYIYGQATVYLDNVVLGSPYIPPAPKIDVMLPMIRNTIPPTYLPLIYH